MQYVLFIGSKVGYEAIKVLSELNYSILHVFIEQEHSHEYEQFYERSIEKCIEANYQYRLNATKKEIAKVVDDLQSVDYIMSFGYRRMIPENVVRKASIAALGTHFSPLPRYRGFAPLNWLLINGEKETAVNLFYLDKEVDNGDIVDREFVDIYYQDDINSLLDKCLVAFKKLMLRAVPMLEDKTFNTEKQDNSKATYTCARNPEDGWINWEWSSKKIYNLVRALTYPFPGAFTYYNEEKLYIWSCEEYKIPIYEGRISGKVIKIIKDEGIVVLCGDGVVLLKDVQLQNGERQTADKVIKSIRVTLGIKV
ncbi:hypothetical protein AN1V17_48460 [Vallitalea sediminicola]